MTHLNELILAQAETFEFVYEGFSGTHGIEMKDYLTDLYSQTSIDNCLHPDDDFEMIIDLMLLNIEE